MDIKKISICIAVLAIILIGLLIYKGVRDNKIYKEEKDSIEINNNYILEGLLSKEPGVKFLFQGSVAFSYDELYIISKPMKKSDIKKQTNVKSKLIESVKEGEIEIFSVLDGKVNSYIKEDINELAMDFELEEGQNYIKIYGDEYVYFKTDVNENNILVFKKDSK